MVTGVDSAQFVPRIWLSEVSALIASIREGGGEGAAKPSEAEMKEPVDEIGRLSTKYVILTEYNTAFLSTENSVRFGAPSDEGRPHAQVDQNLRERAMGTAAFRRVGQARPVAARAPVNQERTCPKPADMRPDRWPLRSVGRGRRREGLVRVPDDSLKDLQSPRPERLLTDGSSSGTPLGGLPALLKHENEKPIGTFKCRQAVDEYLRLLRRLFEYPDQSRESTNYAQDASVDFVPAGQHAFHWFEPKKRGRSFADSAAARPGSSTSGTS